MSSISTLLLSRINHLHLIVTMCVYDLYTVYMFAQYIYTHELTGALIANVWMDKYCTNCHTLLEAICLFCLLKYLFIKPKFPSLNFPLSCILFIPVSLVSLFYFMFLFLPPLINPCLFCCSFHSPLSLYSSCTPGPEPPSNIVFSKVTENSLTVSWTKPKRPVSGFKVTYTHTEDGKNMIY